MLFFFGDVKRQLSTGVLDKILSLTLTDIAGSTPEITQNKPYISARMSIGLFGIASREAHAQGLYRLFKNQNGVHYCIFEAKLQLKTDWFDH